MYKVHIGESRGRGEIRVQAKIGVINQGFTSIFGCFGRFFFIVSDSTRTLGPYFEGGEEIRGALNFIDPCVIFASFNAGLLGWPIRSSISCT